MANTLFKRKSKTSDPRMQDSDENTAPGLSHNAVAHADQPEVGPASASGAKPYGIKVFHEGTDAVVDIVFIHGLTGHRDKTWTSQGASKPWPTTLLHGKLSNARLLTFGYDSEVVKWKEMVSRNRLEDHARNPLSALAAHREETDTEDRNLIFVCHSLGGLLCENALVVARNNTGEEHLHQIFTCTRGILFLGTPHCGSDLAKWGSMFSSLLGAVKQTNPDIVNVLKENSEVLAIVQKAFHEMLRTRNRSDTIIEITCCNEELPLPGIGIVVPEHSAVLPGYVAISIPENHMGMTKFSSSEDPGFKTVTSELRRWIQRLSKEKEDLSSSAEPQLHGPSLHAAGPSGKERIVMLPYGRNSNYVARDQAMKALVDALYPQFATPCPDTHTRIALCGLGGTGKTQIAIQFAHDAAMAFPALSVFWLQALSKESFETDYLELVRALRQSGLSKARKVETHDELKDYLRADILSRWLMIIDNADDGDIFFDDYARLFKLIPDSVRGSILITSRHEATALQLTLNRVVVEVGLLSRKEGLLLVRKYLPDQPRKPLKQLARELGYLPLALVQATAYIRKHGLTLKDYLNLIGREQDVIDSLGHTFLEHGRDNFTIPNAIMTTWLVSFRKVQETSPAAIGVLSMLSFLYPLYIPTAIVDYYLENLMTCGSPKTRNEALGVLQAYSFLMRIGNSPNFTMHPLVQLVMRHWLVQQGRDGDSVKESLKVFAGLCRDRSTAWLTHAWCLLHRWDASGYNCTATEDLAAEEALTLYVCKHLDRRFGCEDPQADALDCRLRIAIIYPGQKRYAEALHLRKQVVELCREKLGVDHMETVWSMLHLALSSKHRDDYAEAEEVKTQVSQILQEKKMSKVERLEMAKFMHVLEGVVFAQECYAIAEVLQEQVRDMRTSDLGDEHPDTFLPTII